MREGIRTGKALRVGGDQPVQGLGDICRIPFDQDPGCSGLLPVPGRRRPSLSPVGERLRLTCTADLSQRAEECCHGSNRSVPLSGRAGALPGTKAREIGFNSHHH